MRIGIFDSGLGGLLLAQAIQKELPQYNYIYLGDTVHMPYGDRSQDVIFRFTQAAVAYLCEQDCQLIILACNTASAEALRKIQMEYLPESYPDRRVLGVLIPAAEKTLENPAVQSVGVLATTSTVHSGAFERELRKIRPDVEIRQQAAPALVPLIENGTIDENVNILGDYLQTFQGNPCDALVLGCTHYGIIKEHIRHLVGDGVSLVSQDEIVPAKLRDYLDRHPEIEMTLGKSGERRFEVTKYTESFQKLADTFYGYPIRVEEISI